MYCTKKVLYKEDVMKRNSLLAMMALCSIFSACGKKSTQVYGAPETSEQAGLIASCTTVTEAKAVAEKLKANYRVINAKKGLVEFIRTDKELAQKDFKRILQEKLPRSRFISNTIYNQLIKTSDNQASQVAIAIKDVQFTGHQAPTYRTIESAEYFPHLKQINADSLIEDIQGEGVTIAIVDTGVYYNHPHLAANIKTSEDLHGDFANNSDDDGNGYIDDYIGWDFYNHDPYPLDDHGHGTHVAGLAAGTLGGIAPKAKILPIKVLSASGSGDLGTIAAGILYAIENGADVINLSLGGPASSQLSQQLERMINIVTLAKENNIMLVAAAGNGGSDGVGDCNDETPVYPANIDSSNVISVAAVNSFNELTSYSNFGGKTVTVAAPGGSKFEGLLSTSIAYCEEDCGPEDAQYANSAGTSMASPIVAGLVALIKGANPALSHQDIKELIMNNGSNQDALKGVIQSGQVINVQNTLEAI
jgi:subtilisin family serine protease